MLRFTFVYEKNPDGSLDTITREFDDEHMALAVELENDPDLADMSLFGRMWEARDLIGFQRIFA